MALPIRRSAASMVFPVATQPGRSGTDAPQSLRGSLLIRTRYCTFLMNPSASCSNFLAALPIAHSLYHPQAPVSIIFVLCRGCVPPNRRCSGPARAGLTGNVPCRWRFRVE